MPCPPFAHPAETALIDPQQRALLEAAAELVACPDGGSSSALLAKGCSWSARSPGDAAHTGMQHTTAVMVGIAKLGEAAAVAAGTSAAVAAGSAYVGTGRALSAAAGRVCYCFALRGPAGEAACSSCPLFACYHAAQRSFTDTRAAMPARSSICPSYRCFALPPTLPPLPCHCRSFPGHRLLLLSGGGALGGCRHQRQR